MSETETKTSMEDLENLKATDETTHVSSQVPCDAAPTQPQLDAYGRIYATGKRKSAIARVWLKSGTGQIRVNNRALDVYFVRQTLLMLLKQPFVAMDRVDRYDVKCFVLGGGLSGQAHAIRHGIAKALSQFDPAFRSPLKSLGFLTRDSRIVERKKYGRRKARRRFQFSKR